MSRVGLYLWRSAIVGVLVAVIVALISLSMQMRELAVAFIDFADDGPRFTAQHGESLRQAQQAHETRISKIEGVIAQYSDHIMELRAEIQAVHLEVSR